MRTPRRPVTDQLDATHRAQDLVGHGRRLTRPPTQPRGRASPDRRPSSAGPTPNTSTGAATSATDPPATIRGVLFLVRHAMPGFGPDVPPQEWQLDAAGRLGAESLRNVLPPDALLVSSLEPKARQTLEPVGPVVTDVRFNEVRRDEPYHGEFRARRQAYIVGTDHPGWEPRRDVVARFATGIQFWHTRVGTRPLVIATHGMAMTLWLAAAVGMPDPADFWAQLRLPDVFHVNLATRSYGRIVSTLLFQVR